MTQQRPAKPGAITVVRQNATGSPYAEPVSASTVRAVLFHFIIGLIVLQPLYAGAQPTDKETARRFSALEQMYLENDQNRFTAFLIENFSDFLLNHPDSKFDAEALWMLADLYDKEHASGKALLTYLKILYFHPADALSDSSRQRIKALIRRAEQPDLLEKSTRILDKLDDKIAYENRATNHFELLSFLYSLEIPILNPTLLNEFRRYKMLYGDCGEKEDVLLLWQGQLNEALKEYRTAEAFYRLFLRLYPQSSLRAEALLHSGMILYRHLQRDEKAIQRFIEIINSYPGSETAGEAQFQLGRLYQLNLHNNQEALSNYQLFIESFPEHPRRAEAMRYSAQILESEARYAEAAQYYNLFYTYFADDTLAAKILLKLADLYEQRLNNPQQAAATLFTFSRKYPDLPQARQALFRAAKLYAEAKQKEKAAEVCRFLLEAYPNGTYAEKARRFLEELKEQPEKNRR